MENYLHFMKNCIRPPYEKLKPLKSGFIDNSNFENDRDPCSTQPITFFTWVDALARCLSAPRCFQGLQAVRHTQQCDSHGQPLNGKDQNCYSSFPYLHHDCMVRGVTPEAKFFKLKHRDVMSSSCAVGQGGHLLKVCMEREIFKTVSHLLLEIRVQVTDCHISCHS